MTVFLVDFFIEWRLLSYKVGVTVESVTQNCKRVKGNLPRARMAAAPHFRRGGGRLSADGKGGKPLALNMDFGAPRLTYENA
jgi:hypothetical protein